MGVLIVTIFLALLTGLLGVLAFVWSLKKGQYDDPEGAAMRILIDDDEPQ